MVKPLLQNAHDPVSEADLERFEKQIGARLPEDYRLFLLEQNGGHFPHDVIHVAPEVDYSKDCLGVKEVYGLGVKRYGLEVTYRDLNSSLPKGFVPIGDDGLGNQICIVVSGCDVGSIWLWDHEAGLSDTWPPENSHRIADSFSRFIDSMIYHPEVEWKETIPAFRAAEQRDANTLAHLLDEGFDLEFRNDRGQTLLICAAGSRQPQIVRLLLDRGANVTARDNQRRTALNRAAACYSLDSAKLLIAAGADLEAADKEGNTPLLKVVPSERLALYLIEHGADVNAVNNRGYRPLQYCTGYDTGDLRAALIRAGADESLATNPVPTTALELRPNLDLDDIDLL